jgi:hypothetical protein
MVDTTPFKICIQRAETRQEWDAMQDDYIARSLEACRRIEQLEAEVLAWQKLGNKATQAMSDAVDDCVRATKLATEKHDQVEAYRELCNRQAQTMAEMSAQIDELAELAGIAVKPTRQ